ncbi:hypothetical protein JGS22_015515 [Streptomyces sp. P38-E01]|uniref:Uncharacterized protein n=1 Tax=Streptomyces tardus TaxID=2780544 RepID=A0A949JI24_9ACTN|nr:hypothetical protein [Streptomyces tardus]MBU7598979.1 hypothetical protein [Streptomyces tardus]
MAASAELLVSTVVPLPKQAGKAEDGDPSKRLLAELLPSYDSGLEGTSYGDWADAPLTSEPPLADEAPLTSESPIAELPLTSEPTGAALYSDGRGSMDAAY